MKIYEVKFNNGDDICVIYVVAKSKREVKRKMMDNYQIEIKIGWIKEVDRF